MSLRRKSCDRCYTARRKCDLSFPICGFCQRKGKDCHYKYDPQMPAIYAKPAYAIASNLEPPHEFQLPTLVNEQNLSHPILNQTAPRAHFYNSSDTNSVYANSSTIPRWLGYLGQLPPVAGTTDNEWVFDVLRNFPLVFAEQGETMFIHNRLYHQTLPKDIRTAFAISATCALLNDSNRSMFFRVLSAEVSDLLTPFSRTTLLEDLARLQAAVLYQIMRIFYGNLEQRINAERQEYLVRAFALTTLRRVDTEAGDIELDWDNWILAESIRRTTVIAFKLYTMYSIFKNGVCSEGNAIGMLPVSSKSGSWSSRSIYGQYSRRDETVTHHEYAYQLAKAGRNDVEPFEQLVMVAVSDCLLPRIDNY